ncbi:MAG: hypothetical protein U0L66_06145 [Acutalibacteraceae bacterium]|nr:hypothetical protein [Acutalibacteraceae bacterium]
MRVKVRRSFYGGITPEPTAEMLILQIKPLRFSPVKGNADVCLP